MNNDEIREINCMKHTKKQIEEAIAHWTNVLKESHPPMDDFLGSKGTFGRNQRDILKRTFDSYGSGYSADAFVAFARELALQDPAAAKKLRQFLGQFASGSLDDKYQSWDDSTGNCSSIAKSLVAILGTALAER